MARGGGLTPRSARTSRPRVAPWAMTIRRPPSRSATTTARRGSSLQKGKRRTLATPSLAHEWRSSDATRPGRRHIGQIPCTPMRVFVGARTHARPRRPIARLTDTLTKCLTAPLIAAHAQVRTLASAARPADIRAWESIRGGLRISPETASDLLFSLVAGAGSEPATSGL